MKRATNRERINAWILTKPSQPDVTVWGVPVTVRLRRALCAAGIPHERIKVGPTSEANAQGSGLLIFRSDYVFDDRLVQAMVDRQASENIVLVTPNTPSDRSEAVAAHIEETQLPAALRLLCGEASPEIGQSGTSVRFVSPEGLVPAYTSTLRKAAPPYLLPAHSERVAEIESRIFAAVYKGVTDLVTKWVWPWPAQTVTRYLAYAGIHPNLVTLLSWFLVVLAAVFFIQGQFGLGLVVAWSMTFLDTVDGKLARVTLTSSRVGHVLDHGLDLLHPPFWYVAWAVGLPVHAVWLTPAIIITIGGYIVGRLIEGLFLMAFKMEIHCWRPIDSSFRTVTARRNPNLILLTAGTLAGRPDIGLVLVASWTVCSIGFHTVRLAQAFMQCRRGHPVRMWQESETAA